MSYLNLPAADIPDSTKGTISLWFRVSNDSIQKAREHGDQYPYQDQEMTILRGTIPLITFGRQLTGEIWGFVYQVDCTGEADEYGSHGVAVSAHPSNPVSSPMEPSHIGLSCWGNNYDYPSLQIVLQTPQHATASGLYNERVECHFSPFDIASGAVFYETIAEASYIRTSWPEAFTIKPKFEVTTDEWHHVLASWDLSTSVSSMATGHAGASQGHQPGQNVSGACKFYFAYDDENKTGEENMGKAWAFKGPNDVVPDGAFLADFEYVLMPPATDPLGTVLVTGNVDVVPQWSWPASELALNGGHVGVPAGEDYVENVYHVEMGELQFFVDYQVDTSDVSVRRAFVDSDGKPVPPKETEEMLGRRPDVLLHGSSNWKNGKNTGSVGLTRVPEGEDEVNDAGQFVPVALIRPYTPDPKLGE